MYKDGRPLGWPEKGKPRPQGDYYCGVGEGNVVGREIVDRHTEACMNRRYWHHWYKCGSCIRSVGVSSPWCWC